MALEFTATDLSVTEEEWGVQTVLAAPSTEEEDFYLMLQRANEFDEQDVKFGMDKPYIEYCGQGWSWYGRILSVELFSDHVLVKMDEVAASETESDGVFIVHFTFTPIQLAQLGDALQRTFLGFPVFVSRCSGVTAVV